MEKTKKPFYKKWWGISLIAFIALVIIGNIFGPSEEEQAAQKAKEEKKEAAETAKVKAAIAEDKKARAEKAAKEEKAAKKAAATKKAKIDDTITAFRLASEEITKNSNGMIPAIDISHKSNFYHVRVQVDEPAWAMSDESVKKSFATSAGNAIERVLAPNDVYTDIVSAQNGDVVATQKLFGTGWKIER